MSAGRVGRRLTVGTRRAASLVAKGARHAVWYVDYRIHGTPREAPDPKPRR